MSRFTTGVVSILFSLLFFSAVCISADFTQKESEAEYLRIFSDFMRAEKGDRANFSAAAIKTAEKYKQFIYEYPLSDLLDEAKLRVAEFYELGYQKQRAKKWLDDIIKNHHQDFYKRIKVEYGKSRGVYYYKNFKLTDTTTKTAAWALYYRALWFWYPQGKFEKAETDLLRIINEYKESAEPVVLAGSLLRKIKKAKQDQMRFDYLEF